MRGFHHANFLQLFREVERAAGPAPGIDRWRADGVEWRRERHGYWGRACSFQIETHELVRSGRGSEEWRFLLVVETWWGRSREKHIRSNHWGKLETGRTADVLRWFKTMAAARHKADA
jgi:hypothetical protein